MVIRARPGSGSALTGRLPPLAAASISAKTTLTTVRAAKISVAHRRAPDDAPPGTVRSRAAGVTSLRCRGEDVDPRPVDEVKAQARLQAT